MTANFHSSSASSSRKSVVSHSLEVSFDARRTPAGETVIIVFKSRGPALQEVATVTSPETLASISFSPSITGAGLPLPREAHTRFAKRVLVDKAVEETLLKNRGEMKREPKVNWSFDDLEDDPPPAPATATARGAPKIDILDKLVIPCHSIKNPSTRRVLVREGVVTRAELTLA
ncbi:hypothetical protein DFH09DRAFT_1110125 [Mycena vulgaris]|nr:hypothetical protein DFH09DRAFT_1110125 [Mycena vulgaris]